MGIKRINKCLDNLFGIQFLDRVALKNRARFLCAYSLISLTKNNGNKLYGDNNFLFGNCSKAISFKGFVCLLDFFPILSLCVFCFATDGVCFCFNSHSISEKAIASNWCFRLELSGCHELVLLFLARNRFFFTFAALLCTTAKLCMNNPKNN